MSSPASSPVLAPPAQLPDDAAAAERRSYGQILKASVMIGGSTLVNVAFGIVRTKAMAVFLGPSGVGLAGVYGSIVDVAASVSGMGLNGSGVRQIAAAAGTGDGERIARIAAVLNRASIGLGVLGAILLAIGSSRLSLLSFGHPDYASPIALLSLAVMFRVMSGGQEALVQGMRRVGDFAKMTVLGAVLGTAVVIPLVYFLREQGIVPALISVAGITFTISWSYSRKVAVRRVSVSAAQTAQETKALLSLGFAFMASSIMMMGSAYIVRITVLQNVGLNAAGLYQSAWTLGGLYVGFILQAMGADFYPRLTACADDNTACNLLVNQQARVGLLLGGPGIIATLTLAPMVLTFFYSSRFQPAVELLRWICLGAMLRVINWPMGFVVIAKGRQDVFFWTEFAWTIANVGLTLLCVRAFSLNGAGIAFFASYVIHGCLIYFIVRRLSHFRWSTDNQRAGVLFAGLIATAFLSVYVLPPLWATCLGIGLTASTSAYSAIVLGRLMKMNGRAPRWV